MQEDWKSIVKGVIGDKSAADQSAEDEKAQIASQQEILRLKRQEILKGIHAFDIASFFVDQIDADTFPNLKEKGHWFDSSNISSHTVVVDSNEELENMLSGEQVEIPKFYTRIRTGAFDKGDCVILGWGWEEWEVVAESSASLNTGMREVLGDMAVDLKICCGIDNPKYRYANLKAVAIVNELAIVPQIDEKKDGKALLARKNSRGEDVVAFVPLHNEEEMVHAIASALANEQPSAQSMDYYLDKVKSNSSYVNTAPDITPGWKAALNRYPAKDLDMLDKFGTPTWKRTLYEKVHPEIFKLVGGHKGIAIPMRSYDTPIYRMHRSKDAPFRNG